MEHAPGKMIMPTLRCHPMVQWKLSAQWNIRWNQTLL